MFVFCRSHDPSEDERQFMSSLSFYRTANGATEITTIKKNLEDVINKEKNEKKIVCCLRLRRPSDMRVLYFFSLSGMYETDE